MNCVPEYFCACSKECCFPKSSTRTETLRIWLLGLRNAAAQTLSWKRLYKGYSSTPGDRHPTVMPPAPSVAPVPPLADFRNRHSSSLNASADVSPDNLLSLCLICAWSCSYRLCSKAATKPKGIIHEKE